MKKRFVDRIIIHCTATREDRPYTLENCNRDHQAAFKRNCQYHVYIRRDGTRHYANDFNEVTWHTGGIHNRQGIGICYEGGIRSGGNPINPKDAIDTRTPVQRAAMIEAIMEAIKWSGNVKMIMGHRDTSPDKDGDGFIEPSEWIKQCPCFDVREWLEGIDFKY
jgi:N-acetylmuramoyl-L-alanine amidase